MYFVHHFARLSLLLEIQVGGVDKNGMITVHIVLIQLNIV